MYVIMFMSLFSIKLFQFIDHKIDGNWREYPPFNMLNHPHPDVYRSFEEIVRNANYTVNSYNVTTEDGYINNMFRIRSENTTGKASVMFVHGVIDSSDAWIANSVENSNAFFLAR